MTNNYNYNCIHDGHCNGTSLRQMAVLGIGGDYEKAQTKFPNRAFV